MKVYVVDAYALSMIGEVVAQAKLKRVLHELTDLVASNVLRYPDSVWRECCRHMDDQGMGLWAKASFGHLPKDASTWEHEDVVLNTVPGLVDIHATEYQTQVDVAKMAVWLAAAKHDVAVVTDDCGERPDRTSLEKACSDLGIASCAVEDFLAEVLTFDYA